MSVSIMIHGLTEARLLTGIGEALTLEGMRKDYPWGTDEEPFSIHLYGTHGVSAEKLFRECTGFLDVPVYVPADGLS